MIVNIYAFRAWGYGTRIKASEDIKQERLAPVMLEWEQQLAANSSSKSSSSRRTNRRTNRRSSSRKSEKMAGVNRRIKSSKAAAGAATEAAGG